MAGPGDVPTVLVRDSHGRQLLCFLEQLIPLDGRDYALLSPVDTPVCLVRIAAGDDGDDEVIEELEGSEDILAVADLVLQEHDLTLVRSALTLTVSGELEEPDQDELDEELDDELSSGEFDREDGEGGDLEDEEFEEEEEFEDEDLEDDEDTGLYEMLVQFRAGDEDYGLYIPLDPFFVVARMEGGAAVLVEGEEFERVQPLIEAELEEREGEG